MKNHTQRQDLISQINAIDLKKVELCSKPVKNGEHVIGTLSENMIRFIGLINSVHREGVLLEEDLAEKIENHPARGGEIESRLLEHDARYHNLAAIFSLMLCEDFPELLYKKHYGIREGGKVVWFETVA